MEFTFAGGNQAGLQLTRAHRSFTDQLFALEQNLDKNNLGKVADVLQRMLRSFEDFSQHDREKLLQGSLTHSEGDAAVAEWIASSYDDLARLARRAAPENNIPGKTPPAEIAAVLLIALLLAGYATKWRKISGQRADLGALKRLHQLFQFALSAKVEATILPVIIERRTLETTIEALYVRALLLERFASGNLAPRRLEILDSWLISWMNALWLTREPQASSPSLCIDTTNELRGLTRYTQGERADLFLTLRPLQRQLDRAVDDFHQGIIFPGWGIGTGFRMEEHIAVIDFLDREFSLIANADVTRSKRFAIGQGAEVKVFCGFNDVWTSALATQSSLTAAGPQHSIAGATVDSAQSSASARQSVFLDTGTFNARALGTTLQQRSPVRLHDMSDSGLGIEMSTEDAATVEVDDLIALRIDEGRPCVLGIVVRKANLHRQQSTLIGVRVLSKAPLRATLEHVTERTARQTAKGILVPGSAEHGFADSVIVNEATFKASSKLSVMIASSIFHIRLGRVRHQGRGWKLVAIDVALAL